MRWVALDVVEQREADTRRWPTIMLVTPTTEERETELQRAVFDVLSKNYVEISFRVGWPDCQSESVHPDVVELFVILDKAFEAAADLLPSLVPYLTAGAYRTLPVVAVTPRVVRDCIDAARVDARAHARDVRFEGASWRLRINLIVV